MAVTPVAGAASSVVTSNTPVTAVGANPQGGFITNPSLNTDQGIGTAETLYVDPTGANPTLSANGTTFALQPGETWNIIPGQTTVTKVNALTAGHKFSAVA